MMGYVHATEWSTTTVAMTMTMTMTPDIAAVHDVAVGEDVGEHALGAELAVSLRLLARAPFGFARDWYLGEVLARCALRQRLVRMQEGTGFAGLASSLAVEFAWHV